MGFSIGILVWIALMVLGMGSFGLAFLDLASALIVIFPSVIVAITATSFATARKSFAIVFSRAKPANGSEARGALVFFRFLGNGALLAGALGTIIGVVIMLQNLDDLSTIGPPLAMAILTIFYGLIVKFFAAAAESRVKFKSIS